MACVHVIDDDEDIRRWLVFSLASAGLATRAYPSAVAFIGALPGLEPGCIVSDVRMPELSGLDLLATLKSQGVSLPVVMISGSADVPVAVEAMRRGAVHFLEKPFRGERLVEVVREALAQAPAAPPADKGRYAALIGSLTPRLREVLAGVVQGNTNKVIARDLGISVRTVESYRADIMARTGAQNLSELIRLSLSAPS